MPDDNNDNDEQPFNFAAWLETFGHGAANKQAGQLMRHLILACQETGKTGSMVITLKVGAASGLSQIAASVKVTEPQAPLPGGAYYVTQSGALVTEDPRQTVMPKRILEPTPIRALKKEPS